MKSQQQQGKKNIFHRMRKNGKDESETRQSSENVDRGHSNTQSLYDQEDYDVENIITKSDMNVAGDFLQSCHDEDIPLPILSQCTSNKEKRENALMGLADAVNALDELTATHFRHCDDQRLAGPESVEEVRALRTAVHNLSKAFANASLLHKGRRQDQDVDQGASQMANYHNLKIRRKPVPRDHGLTMKKSMDNNFIRNIPVSILQSGEFNGRLDFTADATPLFKPLHYLDVDTEIGQEATNMKDIVSRFDKGSRSTSFAEKESSTMYAGRSISLPILELDLPINSSRFSQDYSTTRYSSDGSSAAARSSSRSSLDSILSDEERSSTGSSSVSSVTSSPALKNIELPEASGSLGLTGMHIFRDQIKTMAAAPHRPNRHPNRYSNVMHTKRQAIHLDPLASEDELHTYIIDYDQYISSNDETPKPSTLGFSIQ